MVVNVCKYSHLYSLIDVILPATSAKSTLLLSLSLSQVFPSFPKKWRACRNHTLAGI